MKTKEHQIGELLANSVEDHFFNPAALGRYLADQPIYTVDRVMEVVAWIIEKNTNLKIGDSYLIWINENSDNYKVYKCKDLQAELKLMIEHYENTKNKKG